MWDLFLHCGWVDYRWISKIFYGIKQSIPQMGVFLSFRGIDTRRTFVGHLHKSLVSRGIIPFKDDVKIKTGEPFPTAILEAIQNSSFAIIVISPNFTSSKWCLIELRKIMELWSHNKIIVVPIFYQVEPSDLRKEEGLFLKPLKKHRRPPFAEEVPKWKEALTKLSYLHGKDPRNFKDDAAMIEDIVDEISFGLSSMLPIHFGDVVGMTHHMERLDSILNLRSKEEVRLIGIWGMGGVGKTTIAKCLFTQYSREFSAHCLIEDVWEKSKTYGLVGLQEKFVSSIFPEDHIKLSTVEHGRHHIKSRLRHRRVLAVLDGVDTMDQIWALAEPDSMFGLGSRIIITTRDRSLLRTCGVVEGNLYEVSCLGSDDSLLMFKHFAFGGGSPPSDAYEQLSVQASQLAYGLPTTLEAFGTLFRGKTTVEWEDELRTLRKTPHENTVKILKISYNDLHAIHKNVFLHIACLFNGDSILRVRTLVDNVESGIKVLSDKSLINISTDGYLKMHVLVEQTGRQIVLQESKRKPRKQIILWDPQDICKVLRHNSGTDHIQALALPMCEMERTLAISCSTFKPLYNLRILKFYKYVDNVESKLQFVSENHLLSHDMELRLLHWDACPSTTLPFNLYLECLVELIFRFSNLESLWDGTPDLGNLRRLDVTGSKNLKELPNISKARKLKDLLMDSCTRLQHLPGYIGSLYNLGKLHAVDCDGLRSHEVKILRAQDPKNLFSHLEIKFEFTNEPLQFIENLCIEGRIKFSVHQFHGDADHFSFNSERKIPYQLMLRPQHLPHSTTSEFRCLEIKRNYYTEEDLPFRCIFFAGFPHLAALNLINLKIEYIPSNISLMTSLERLNLSGNDFKKLPNTISNLSSLKYIDLHNCCKLEALPPLTQVETLILSDCISLKSLMGLPTLGEDCGRYRLLELEIDNCNKVQSLSDQLSHFTNLKELNLSRHEFVILPESIKVLSSLQTLSLNNCKKLKSLEELPLSLKCLYAHGCDLLERVCLSSDLEEVDLSHCFRLQRDEEVPSECGYTEKTEVPEFCT